MPSLSRWCVWCALIYLVVGMDVGSWLLIEQANGHSRGTTWPVLHPHLLRVGFVLLMVIGVAHWMSPRVHRTRGRQRWRLDYLRPGQRRHHPAGAGRATRQLGRGQPWQVARELAAVLPTLGIAVSTVTILPHIRAAMTPDKGRELRARANRE